MNLKTRLAKLEASSAPQTRPIAILRQLIGARHGKPVELPVSGWRLAVKPEPFSIMRAEGESDAALQERAIQAAHATSPSNIVRLISIVDQQVEVRHERT